MADAWKEMFDNFGIKTVTKTDEGKGAYVPNLQQRKAIEAAGISPASTRPAPEFDVTVLFDPAIPSVKSSYYYAERSKDADRTPEPRMGHAIISSWLKEGDQVLIGNIGNQVFAAKLASAPTAADDAAAQVATKTNEAAIMARAKKATGKPEKRVVQRQDYVRDPWVVAGAIKRSKGECEVPSCTRPLFVREDDTPYLEVHHITPLAEGGDDSLQNAAAICPHCHRELHHGKHRTKLRAELAAHVSLLKP